jgi:hypothetical protein
MYVIIGVNGKDVTFMLNSSDTNMFVSSRLVPQLGWWLRNNYTTVKVVNAKAHRIVGRAYGVPIVMDKWHGKHDLLVVMLDDFDIIIGQNFLRKAKIVLLSYLNSILINNELCQCVLSCCEIIQVESNKRGNNMI